MFFFLGILMYWNGRHVPHLTSMLRFWSCEMNISFLEQRLTGKFQLWEWSLWTAFICWKWFLDSKVSTAFFSYLHYTRYRTLIVLPGPRLCFSSLFTNILTVWKIFRMFVFPLSISSSKIYVEEQKTIRQNKFYFHFMEYTK